jgi:putative DNA methylase
MSVPQPQPLIDTSFDVGFADRLARYETYNKHHYRPNTYLHKWWGRRCGSTFRLILKGLVDDPARAGYYAPGGLAGKIILDPMMGGGTTLHEAIRLGAGVIGVDIDPIPILQARATLTEYPLAALEAGFEAFYRALDREVGDCFQTHCPTCDEPTPAWHVLHGARRRCGCGEALIVDSLVIRHQPDGGTLRLCPHCAQLVDDRGPGRRGHDCPATATRLVEKGQTACGACGAAYEELTDAPFYARYEMLVVAGHCPTHGLFHRVPDWRDRARQASADARRAALPFAPALFCVEDGDKSVQLLRRGIHSYLDLFSSRQLIFLDAAGRHLPDEPIVRLNLALLVSTALEFNSMLCGYKGDTRRRAGAVRHTFSHHGYAFPYTALETNPLYPRLASGTLQKLFYNRIQRARRWAAAPLERDLAATTARFVPIAGERDGGQEVGSAAELAGGPQRFVLSQGSAVALPVATGSVDAVVTDPPYYDSIQYGDLAAFFRVWLRRFLPDSADWGYDGAGAAVSSERDPANGRYGCMLAGIFGECRRVLRPDGGRLIFTFHHWQPRAWAALTTALYEAGFVLLNRYVVHAEHLVSVHISNVRALTHDAILVLAPAAAGAGAAWARPLAVRATGAEFTADCATLLGWLLSQPGLTAADIERIWQATLAGTGPALPDEADEARAA